MCRFIIFLLILFVLSPCIAEMNQPAQGLTIGTWNTNKLGYGKTRDWRKTGEILKDYDFVALQEVMSHDALVALVGVLNEISKTSWDYLITDKPVGKGEHQEYLAFIWKKEKVIFENVKNTYHNTDKRFVRPPFAARFTSIDGTHRWLALNVHLIESKNKDLIREEVLFLDDYFIWAQDFLSESTPILLMGEFGLDVLDPSYNELKVIASNLLRNSSTAIPANKNKLGFMTNNVWEESSGGLDVVRVHVNNFLKNYNYSNNQGINKISDRLPVKIKLGNKTYKKSNYIRPKFYKEDITKLHIMCVHPSKGENISNYSNEFIMLKNGDRLFDIALEGWELENDKGETIPLEGMVESGSTFKIYSSENGKKILSQDEGLVILKTPTDKEYFRLGYKSDSDKGFCHI